MKVKYIWIIAIRPIAISVRIFFNARNPQYTTIGDTVSYYLTTNIFLNSRIAVDPWRTLCLSTHHSYTISFGGKRSVCNISAISYP